MPERTAERQRAKRDFHSKWISMKLDSRHSTHMPKQQRTYCAYILAKLAIFILFSSSLFDALAFKFLRQNKTYLPRFTMIRDKMFCIILNKFGLISVMFFFTLRWIKYPISTAQTEQKRMEERKYE